MIIPKRPPLKSIWDALESSGAAGTGYLSVEEELTVYCYAFCENLNSGLMEAISDALWFGGIVDSGNAVVDGLNNLPPREP